ncbi:M1 family metallopeptidase [Actinomadura keratinilytica]|jgi:aminopeptidase N|uniref:M1 family metallopeptidase n=1 Tax=Actinomadura keratinilytica TaxID=547461 RepID=UPI0031E54D46
MNGVWVRATAATTAAVLLVTTGGGDASAVPGEDPADYGVIGGFGLGDPYFPHAGNGGYDVQHYDVDLTYSGRKGGEVDAAVTVNARAAQSLSAFSLDFRGPAISSVTVEGRPARHERDGQELMIIPPRMIPAGQTFTAVVRYAGRPGPMPDGPLGTYGWIPTRDGAVVLSQPDGAPTWLPVNDHPSDKATYSFRITVPKGLRAVANGRPGRVVRRGGRTTYEWAEDSPMASYLATVAIGRFRMRRGRAGRIPVITAVDPKFRGSAERVHRTTIKAVRWAEKMFGRYPFATAGAVVDDPQLDYALETQERPVYAGFVPSEEFIVHELAHQWFGNSVSVRNWRDIWLNEGFATYAEWLWRERGERGGRHRGTAEQVFRRYYRMPGDSSVFRPPPGVPGRKDMFGFSVYTRGAMCLHALRRRVGDRAFFAILREWARTHRDGSATTPEFVRLSERISGRDLDGLFRAWLYGKGKPRRW